MTDEQSYSVKMVRIISTFMIFLCHTVFLFGDVIGLSAQFFNIAVTVFFFISAYLFSLREKIGGVLCWYKRRLVRIIVPYYILHIVLIVLYLIFGKEINVYNWITNLFIVSGITETPVSGTGHMWFISAILICYIVTPLLYRIRENNKSFILFLLMLFVLYVFIAIYLKDIIGTYFISVFEYILAFFVLKKYINKINPKKADIIGFIVLIIGCLLKIVFVKCFDNTILYLKFLVQLCSVLIGFGIFTTIYFFTINNYKFFKKFYKVVSFLDGFSYEFYLVHMILIQGELSILLFKNSILNIILAFVVSSILGYMLHLVSNSFIGVMKWDKKC